MQLNIPRAVKQATGVTYHPASQGRVIILDPPYELPPGMDLRGIAGVVLKKEPNKEILSYIDGLSDEKYQAVHRGEASYVSKQGVIQKPPQGPRPSPPLPEEILMDDISTLGRAFNRLTGIDNVGIHLRPSNAPLFHMDGAGGMPSWRLTYAFTGDQTEWHTALANVPGRQASVKGGTVFPLLRDNEIGENGIDFFPAEGALIFRTFSGGNGLFHRTPPNQPERRLVLTFDGLGSKNPNCGQNCPFPCRAP